MPANRSPSGGAGGSPENFQTKLIRAEIQFHAKGIREAVAGIRAVDSEMLTFMKTISDSMKATYDLTKAEHDRENASRKAAEAAKERAQADKDGTSVMKEATGRATGYAKSLFGVGDAADSASSKINILIAAIKLLYKAMAAAVQAAADLEFQMARIALVAGETVTDVVGGMEQLEDAVVDMATTSIFDFNEISDAMYKFAAAGTFTAEEIEAATRAVVNLAQSTGYIENIGEVSESVAAIMHMFGGEIEDITRIVDVMAKVANDSLLEIKDIGIALQYVGPWAVTAGQSFEEISAALAVLANMGMRASSAGRYLRQTFTYLANRTPQAEEAFKRLGLRTTDAQGNFRDLNAIVSDLTVSLRGLSEKQRVEVLKAGFGVWGATALANLTIAEERGLKALNDKDLTLKEVKEGIYQKGLAEEKATDITNTYTAQQGILVKKFKAVAIAAGDEALPAMADLYRTIGRIMEKEGFKDFIDNMATSFGYLARALGIAAEKLEDLVDLYERSATFRELMGNIFGGPGRGIGQLEQKWIETYEEGGTRFQPPGMRKTASNIITNNTNIVVTTPSVDGGIIGQGLYREQRYIQRGFQ